jgi:hypothetical protein
VANLADGSNKNHKNRMTVHQRIFKKIYEKSSLSYTRYTPKKLILGHEDYNHLIEESTQNDFVCRFKWNNEHFFGKHEYCGMKITLSRKKRYLRVI